MKKLIAFFSTMFVLVAMATAVHGQIIVGNYTATSFQSGATLPSSCSGSAIFTLTTTWTPYYCDGGTYVAFGTGGSSATATSLANGTVGAEPYQTAASTTAFVYPATDTVALNVDGNRTDSYTPDGTPERPFLTIDAALAYISSQSTSCTSGSPCAYSIYISPALYTSTSAISTNQYQSFLLTCNGATWVDAAGITFNSPVGIDHCFIGNSATPTTISYEHNYTTQRSRWKGGSSFGTINVGNASNTAVILDFDGVTVGGLTGGLGYSTLNVYGTTFGVKIVGQINVLTKNATAVFSCDTCRFQGTTASPNVDTTAGGEAIIIGGQYSTASYIPNFNFTNANSATTAHSIQGPVVISGQGLSVGTSTYWCGNLIGGISGTGISTGCNSSSLILSSINSAAATALSITSGTTGTLTLDSGTTGTVSIGTGTSDKTITIGGTGADTIAVGNNQVSGSVSIGTSMTTGAIHIGSYVAGTGLIEIAPGTGTQSVNVATTATGVKTVTIGNAVSGSKVDIYGEIDGGAVGNGYIGQVLSILVPIGSAVSLTTATPANAIGITLSAGDWDVEASVNFSAVSATIVSSASYEIGLGTVPTTLPSDGSEIYLAAPVLTATSAIFGGSLPRKVFRLTGSSNVYVVVNATFSAGTVAAYGSITARRVH